MVKLTAWAKRGDHRLGPIEAAGHVYHFPIKTVNYDTESVINAHYSPYEGEHDFLLYVGRTTDLMGRLSAHQTSNTGIEIYDLEREILSTDVEYYIPDLPEYFFCVDYSTICQEMKGYDDVDIEDVLDARERDTKQRLKNDGYAVVGGK